MGTQKFKLSNIIPNIWFHKLKSIKNNKPNTNSDQASNEAAAISIPLQVTISRSRKSYYIKSSVDSPTKMKPSRKGRSTTKSSVSTACNCATSAVQSVRSKSTTTTTTSSSSVDNLSLPPEARSFDRMLALSSTSCNCSSNSLLVPDFDDDDDDDDAVIGVDTLSLAPRTEDTAISRIDLPPIKTEHKKFSDLVTEIGPRKQRKGRRSGSPRIRIRTNSKRVGSHDRRRRSSESMAVIKTSADPERDFRESMVEMIAENEIRGAKDLEELLACYLSLNSIEYHHLIVEVFKQIWFDLNGIH